DFATGEVGIVNIGVSEPCLKIRDEDGRRHAINKNTSSREVECVIIGSAANIGKACKGQYNRHGDGWRRDWRAAVNMRDGRWRRKARKGFVDGEHVGGVVECHEDGPGRLRKIRWCLVRAKQSGLKFQHRSIRGHRKRERSKQSEQFGFHATPPPYKDLAH